MEEKDKEERLYQYWPLTTQNQLHRPHAHVVQALVHVTFQYFNSQCNKEV